MSKKTLAFFLCLPLFCIFTLLFFLFPLHNPIAADCDNIGDLNTRISCLTDKTQQLHKQADTLSSQIDFMNAQISLAQTRIQETENQIETTQKEIDLLGSRIEGLDTSLDVISKLLLNRVVRQYKQHTVSIFDLLLDSSNANDLVDKIKYLKSTQQDNQKLLVQVQLTKTNFEEQKKLREEKKIKLDKLNEILNQQKVALNTQKIQKQKLLSDTQNDETTFQQLLAQAKVQLAAFKSFSLNAGADVIGSNQFGNGSDGNYYSQRDSRWAGNAIGYSGENILNVGCLITSIAMTAKKLGANLTPANIAADVGRFFGNTAYMRLPWAGVGGKSYVAVSNIDEELKNGNYVIVGIRRYSCASGGDHFVVLTKKEGNDYIMHDPIYGPDLKFSQYYSTICSSATFK